MTNSLSDSSKSITDELLARLNRIPVLGTHYFWASLLAFNLMLEYYDNVIFAYAAPVIQSHTGYSTEQIGMIASIFFVGMVLGSIIGGKLSDIFGRRSIIFWSTIIYSLGSLITAISTTYEVTLISRAVTGFGVQAASSVLYVYVAEMFPSKTRGRFMSIALMGLVAATITAAAIAMFYLPNSGPNAWRSLFYVGGLGLLIAPFLRLSIPESVRWYISRKEYQRANEVLNALEEKARKQGDLPELNIVPIHLPKHVSLKTLLKNKATLNTIIVLSFGFFGATLGYYLFGNWALYSLIYGLKYSEEQAYNIFFYWNLVYASAPFITMIILDRYERKTMIISMSILSALPLVLLGMSSTSWILIVAGGAMAVISGVVFNIYYTYIPETIPTQFRALGSGFVIGCGRFGGAASGVLGAWLFTSYGMQGIMFFAAACFILFALPVVFFGPRTTNMSLEAVNEHNIT